MKRLGFIMIFVFCAVNLFSQNNADLSAKVLDYYGKLPQEKIYVHTDKSVYSPGDTIWFRAYVLDAATNQLADRSKFVYIELLDNRADTLVMRKKIKSLSPALSSLSPALSNGVGEYNSSEGEMIFANALALPKNLKDGTYTLAAYTQWMRNFGESGFYKKQLQIVGAGLVSARDYEPNGDLLRADISVPRETGELEGGWPAPTENMENRSFLGLMLFPEGGNLLAGINQRLAYKAVGADGLGVDVSVRLINEQGEVRQEGRSQHLGMGDLLVFVFPGERLFLEATTADGRSAYTALPEALTTGATLSVTQRSGQLFIQPQATADFNLSALQLLIYGAGNLMTVETLSPTTPVRIPLANLHPGVLNIALVNPQTKQVHAERLAFIRQ